MIRGDSILWTLLLTITGIVAGLLGAEMPLIVGDLLMLTFYCVVALTPAIVSPAQRWMRNDTLPSRPVDAVVVLSSDVTTDTTLGAEGADRLLTGLELVQRGVAPLLVTTRVLRTSNHLRLTSDSDQHRLVALAGLESRWLTVDSVSSTRDEAVRVSAALPSAKAQRIVVVTSPLHTRRACATFETVGFSVSCVAARMRSYAAWNPIGSDDRLKVFQAYVYERLGMVKYRALGWVR